MTDERESGLLFESWLKGTDPTPPDASQSVAQVMDRLPQTRQRARWWPLPALHRPASGSPSRASTAPRTPARVQSATRRAEEGKTTRDRGLASSVISRSMTARSASFSAKGPSKTMPIEHGSQSGWACARVGEPAGSTAANRRGWRRTLPATRTPVGIGQG